MDNQTKEELLPCPFCGSQPEWINEMIQDGHYYIRCPHCHIVFKEDRRDKVIGMWNSRKLFTKQQVEEACLTEKTSAIYWSKIGLEIKQILDTDGFDEDRMGLIREVFEKYS